LISADWSSLISPRMRGGWLARPGSGPARRSRIRDRRCRDPARQPPSPGR
jgi:hypothetical protein